MKVFQIIAMDSDFSISDFITLPAFAWKLYRKCRDSQSDFKNLSQEVASLHVTLKEATDYVSEGSLNAPREKQLLNVGEGCRRVMLELDLQLERFWGRDKETQNTWHKIRVLLDDITALRARLVSNTTELAAFNSVLAR
jgi:hypothetical protein